ncbi:hypothetical protein SUGI_0973370 [Cryptomeria japonica]|uniref:nuclear transcription factor Y subunit B-1-like n=1 Tax=Cryptomeria japonica TaxID=3369 RepID=UPI002414AAF8|nr:nuclear transcription factor Y subunit B-1-like [Cryptomeria japonica]GLJ46199.1 hypothetical protein SUGI_0973370 [Cryptomeria japonica]
MGDNTLNSSNRPSDIDLNKGSACGEQREVQDRLLPMANVGNIMRKILPPKALLSKEAKITMQECVSEFVSFVTAEASHQCRKDNRKTITGEDLVSAMASLGLEVYAEALDCYLQKYREKQGEIVLVTKNGFSNPSCTEDNQRPTRVDHHYVKGEDHHYVKEVHPVEGSNGHNQWRAQIATVKEKEFQGAMALAKYQGPS